MSIIIGLDHLFTPAQVSRVKAFIGEREILCSVVCFLLPHISTHLLLHPVEKVMKVIRPTPVLLTLAHIYTR